MTGRGGGGNVSGMLVLGMGAYVFGRERRAVGMLGSLKEISPHFLITQWEGGDVAPLLEKHGLSYEHVPFGSFWLKKPRWLAITLFFQPVLYGKIIAAYLHQRCSGIILLGMYPLFQALAPILFLRFVLKAQIVPYFGDVFSDTKKHRFVASLLKMLARRYIVNVGAVKESLMAHGIPGKDITVVYNGVDTQRYRSVVPCNLREQCQWPKENVIVGYVGQVARNKGIEDFLSAAQRCADNRHCSFVVVGSIAGNDPFLRQVQESSKNLQQEGRLVFVDWQEEIERVYAALDIVVFPSRCVEASANVILEAMASAKPVVATRIGGIPEVVDEGTTGLLVEPNTPEAIARSVGVLAQDASLRERMGRAGQRRISERFNRAVNARLVEEVLCAVS